MGGPLMGGRGSRGRALPQVGWENGIVPPAPTEQVDPAGTPDASGPAREARVENQIREAFDRLVANSDDHIMLSQLRDALPDLDRTEVDEALTRLATTDPLVHLVPESNQKTLYQSERDRAIQYGNRTRHLIRIEKPIDTGAWERISSRGVTAASDADLAMAQRDPATRSAEYDAIRAEVRRRKDHP